MTPAIAARAPALRLRPDFWRLAATAIAVAMLLPLLALGWSALQGSEGLWSHSAVYVLPRWALNTVLLLAGVGALAVAIGSGAACLVTARGLRARRFAPAPRRVV